MFFKGKDVILKCFTLISMLMLCVDPGFGASDSDSNDEDDVFTIWEWQTIGKIMLPAVSDYNKKGDSGKILFIGGSVEYANSLYFAAISAFKTGADWIYVITTREAAAIVQSYSPDIIVCPYMDNNYMAHKFNIDTLIDHVDLVVIGPGLRIDIVQHELTFIEKIINETRHKQKPLIVSDRGLDLISKNFSIIIDYPEPGVILVGHYDKFKTVHDKMRNKFKGWESLGTFTTYLVWHEHVDYFNSKAKKIRWILHDESTRKLDRRGDILTGTLAPLFQYGWTSRASICDNNETAASIATYASSRITRICDTMASTYFRTDSIKKESQFFRFIGNIGLCFEQYYNSDLERPDDVFRDVPKK